MVWKKNAVSYLAWLVYTLAVGGILVALMRVLCGQDPGQHFLYVGLTAGYALAAGLFVFLANRIAGKKKAREGKKRIWLTVEILAVVLLLAAGLVLRIQILDRAGGESAYFEAAKMAEGQDISRVAHGAVLLYLQVLHMLFRFLGNKMILGVWLQIWLQLAGGFFLFLAVRKLAGVLPGLVMLGLLMCTENWIGRILELSPEMFYLFLLSVGLAAVASLGGKKIRILPIFLAGIGTGVLGYLDVSGCLLLLFGAAVLLSGDGKDGWKQKFLGLASCVLGAGLGFAGAVLADSLISRVSFLHVLESWGTLYGPEPFMLPATSGTVAVPVEALVVSGLMGLGIFSFWCGGKKERMTVWILALGAAVAFSSFGIFASEIPGYGLLYWLCCVLAGVSFGECFHREQETVGLESEPGAETAGKDEIKEETEEDLEIMQDFVTAQETEADREAEADRETGADRETEADREAEADWETEAKREAEADRETEAEADRETEANREPEADQGTKTGEETERPKVKLIENPLPLPRKHEKRVMDYARNLSAGEEDFDILVKDEDDFDLI